ncbi:hypothetical protein [Pantoea sp. 1.19]|uniref:hypothetical protein n=1 Tax=Pantoea sp. 1.19 TaxID=1925589 RepID=UPI001F0A1883|nr:hypothetical protein [Pantoea sp. 1.19]
MGKALHPILAFTRQGKGWSSGIGCKVDRWREAKSAAPRRFMTFYSRQAWLTDWLKHHPAPAKGFLSLVIMTRFPPHSVYMTLAAWRAGKTLLHCDKSCINVLGETRQTDTLSGKRFRRRPFWGGWLGFMADTVFFNPQGALLGALFTLADHHRETDARLSLTLSQGPASGRNIPRGGTSLALSDPLSTVITQQDEGGQDGWHAVLPVLFWLCAEHSKWEKRGRPVRSAFGCLGKHQRLIPAERLVLIVAGVRAGSGLGQIPRSPYLWQELSHAGPLWNTWTDALFFVRRLRLKRLPGPETLAWNGGPRSADDVTASWIAEKMNAEGLMYGPNPLPSLMARLMVCYSLSPRP